MLLRYFPFFVLFCFGMRPEFFDCCITILCFFVVSWRESSYHSVVKPSESCLCYLSRYIILVTKDSERPGVRSPGDVKGTALDTVGPVTEGTDDGVTDEREGTWGSRIWINCHS